MRRGIACGAVVAAALLVEAASASAAMLCVPNVNVPACHGSGLGEPTIMAAVNTGHSGDVIVIGAGLFNETVSDNGTSYTFIGAGPAQTIIRGQGSPAMTVSPGSSVANLGIDLHNGTGNTGLSLAGKASNVAVTATQPLSTTNNIGVALNGGTFSHGAVTLPLTGGDAQGYAGVTGAGIFSDSNLTAAVGADAAGRLDRDRILANQGVIDAGSPLELDDSAVRTLAGAAPELGLATSAMSFQGTLTARHVDVIGSGSAGSEGVQATSSAPLGPHLTTVTLDGSIIRGYGTSIRAVATNGPIATDTAATDVFVSHTFYDAAHTSLEEVSGATAAILADAQSGNVDPLFVNAAAGDFHLRAGSPAIDYGASKLAAGESVTDLEGHRREIAGRKGDGAISDVGALEFQPHAPTLHASVTASRSPAGKPATFRAAGTDASPGDSVSYRWRFDDGAGAATAAVSHAFGQPGRHHATVTATDLDGFTATVSLTVTVTGPAISKLVIAPQRVPAGGGATITYRDSQAAQTTINVLKAKSGQLVAKFIHRDRAGKNHVRWRKAALPPGRYRLEVIPHDNAGTGPSVFVKFRIIR